MSTFFLPSLFPEIYLNNLCHTLEVSTWNIGVQSTSEATLDDAVPETPLQRLAHRRARLRGSIPSALRSGLVGCVLAAYVGNISNECCVPD